MDLFGFIGLRSRPSRSACRIGAGITSSDCLKFHKSSCSRFFPSFALYRNHWQTHENRLSGFHVRCNRARWKEETLKPPNLPRKRHLMDDIREFGPLKCLAPTSYRPFLATSSGQTVMSSGDLSIVSEFPRRLLSIESIKPRMSDVVFEI